MKLVFLLKKSFQNKKYGGIILSQLIQENPRRRYLANVNPKNIPDQKNFSNLMDSNSFKKLLN